MDSNKRIACMAAMLVTFAVACQNRSGEDQTGLEPQEPSVQPDQPAADQQGAPGAAQPGDGMEGRGAALDVSEVAKKPEARIGERVTLKGKIDAVLGERGFELASAKMGGGEVIVLGRQDIQSMTDDWQDKPVKVSGTLRRTGSAQELERELGWTLDSELERKLSDAQVVLIANSVQPMTDAELKASEKAQDVKEDIRKEQKDVQEEMKDVQKQQRELEQEQDTTRP